MTEPKTSTPDRAAAPADGADVEDWRSPLTPEQRADITARVDALRDEIDRLDEQLVQSLNARAGCALQIGELKKRLQLEIYQPAREEAVLRHVRSVNQGPLDSDAIARLFERIIDEARRLERVVQAREHEREASSRSPEGEREREHEESPRPRGAGQGEGNEDRG